MSILLPNNLFCMVCKYFPSQYVIIYIICIVAITGCSDETFTEEELQRTNVYSKGDQFTMAANYGDTLTFTIEEKKLREAGGRYGPKHEILTYDLLITSIENGQYVGGIEIYSYKQNAENVITYGIDAGSLFEGEFKIKTANETVIINGITYHNANCNENTCFSTDHGFLKFMTATDTLVLLP